MKGKIVGILICMFILTPVLTATQHEQNIDLVKESNPQNQVIIGPGVPIWNEGDRWVYKIDDITINFEENNQSVNLHLEIDEFPLEVISTIGDYYTVQIDTTNVNGDFDINIETEEGPIDITGDFKQGLIPTTIEGSIIFNKSDLGIKAIQLIITGRISAVVREQPFFTLPINFSWIPIPITIELNTDIDPVFQIIQFPLANYSSWGLENRSVHISGEVRSLWLQIIDLINKIAALFNLELLPPEIADLLPDVDIESAFQFIGLPNPINVTGVEEDIFVCTGQENITLPPGDFHVYNITIGGVANMFYSAEAKNIVKVEGIFEEVIPYVSDVRMELIEIEV